MTAMRNKCFLAVIALVPLLASCASQRAAVAPVGPAPESDGVSSGSSGYLEVYSAQEPVIAGDDPIYYQHTDYRIYDERGKRIKHVGNADGHFETKPTVVALPPGRYTVKARAEDYASVVVRVVIERGRTTVVHLDDQWRLPANISRNEFVFEPTGSPVGWRAR